MNSYKLIGCFLCSFVLLGCTHYGVEHEYKQRNISVTSGVYDNGVYTEIPANTTITIIENNPIVYPSHNFYNNYPHYHNHYQHRPIIIKYKK